MNSLIWLPYLPLLGTLVPIFSARLSSTACAFMTAALPAITLLLILSHSGDIYSGERFFSSLPWVAAIGLELAFRLDGLS
ncbi:hypothetical protein, partial [Marinomonas arenicola]